MTYRSADCITRIIPESLNYPVMNNEQYSRFFSPMIPLFRNFTITVDEEYTVVDVERRKVCMHLRSKADTDVGDYSNEYIFSFTMTEDGSRVCEMVEYSDSAFSKSFFPRLLEKAKKAGEKQGDV